MRGNSVRGPTSTRAARRALTIAKVYKVPSLHSQSCTPIKAQKHGRAKPLLFEVSVCALFLYCILYIPGLCAQTPQTQGSGQNPVPEQPVAPLGSDVSSGSGQPSYGIGTQDSTTQTEPDTNALSGIQSLTTGSLPRLTGIFDPGLYFSELGYSGLATAQPGTGTTTSGSTAGITLDAEKSSRSLKLAITYKGTDTYYYPSAFYGPRNMPSHSLGLSLEAPYRRWTFRLRDNFLYSWQAGFGGTFTGGPALETQNSPIAALQPSLNPVGTILTGFAKQANNSASGEADYSLSHRTTVTISGSYALLDFVTPGYLNSHSIDARAGYNYSLSSKNTIALLLQYDRTSFSGNGTLFDSDLLQPSFGRRITGRLAFQVAAGPELTVFRTSGAPDRRQLSWSVSTSLTRQTARTGYSISYFRGVSPGSGVFFGSEVNTLTASANHVITRSWSASVNGGYALNNPLVPVGIFTQNFKDWFAGANLSSQIGRHLRFALTYQYQQQIMGSGACPVASCGVIPAYQVFGITVNWHPLSKGA